MLISTMVTQATGNVRRGYRLHISNLADQAITFQVKYWVTPPNGEPRWAAVLDRFFTLYAGQYGEGVTNWTQTFVRNGSVYVAAMSFIVEARHTVPVGITPSLSLPSIENLHLVEGYVTLEVPVLRDGQGKMSFRPQPQSADPIKVMLNPETTMVHIDTSGAGALRDMDGRVTGHVSVTRLDFDSVEPIVPASGKAENEVVPNGIKLLSRDALVEAVKVNRAAEGGPLIDTENLSSADKMATLIGLLCELDHQEEFVDELNNVLARNNATARICSPAR